MNLGMNLDVKAIGFQSSTIDFLKAEQSRRVTRRTLLVVRVAGYNGNFQLHLRCDSLFVKAIFVIIYPNKLISVLKGVMDD